MLEIPSSISIAGRRYTVTVKRIPPKHQNAIGLSDHRAKKILLSPILSQEMQREVFWHEVMHCVNYTLAEEWEIEEFTLNRLALGLWEVIRQVYER
jgi:hypothetical protein